MEGKEIYASVSNYYGRPYVFEKEGKYYIGLDDHNDAEEKEISKEFYDAWVKEFGNANNR